MVFQQNSTFISDCLLCYRINIYFLTENTSIGEYWIITCRSLGSTHCMYSALS